MEATEVDPDDLFLTPEDSNLVRRAYSGLLLVWQQGGLDTKSIPIVFMNDLTGHVMAAWTSNPSATGCELIHLAATSLEFVWLLFEHRGQITATEHSELMGYGSNILQVVRAIDQRISSKDQRYKMAQMLTVTETVGLAGRLVLSALDQGNKLQNTDKHKKLLKEISLMEGAIKKSAAAAPELFTDSKFEWAKVFAYLESLVAQITELEPNKEKTQYIRLAFKTWSRHASVLRDAQESQKCAHPRCAQSDTREMALRVRYICERCGSAAYCNLNCQQR
ncbi:hypothetical protein FRC12_017350 [Ceratobasidium sp. 428]|nr:hypothetical protein FRC12_017350 [Ceratobasidium sp. 428]